MTASMEPAPAMQPEDLGEYFLERANKWDVEGLVALYEPGAVLAFPPGRLATGHDEIRAVYTELLAGRPAFSSAGQQPVIRHGELARTPTPGCMGGGPSAREPG